jgi:hypothetical protein
MLIECSRRIEDQKDEAMKTAKRTTKQEKESSVGRFYVELDVANNIDVGQASLGNIPPEQVRRTKISGLVDSGATRLILPPSVVKKLGLPKVGQTKKKIRRWPCGPARRGG